MVIPKAIAGKQPVITVLLSEGSDATRKAFRCPVCGHIAFEYFAPVKVIMPGDGTELEKEGGDPGILIQCHGHIPSYEMGYERSARCNTMFYVT